MRTVRIAPWIAAAAISWTVALQAQTDDYRKAVRAQRPDHYYQLDEIELGPVLLDDAGDPVPLIDAGGLVYESPVEDTGFADPLIEGWHEGRFEPMDTTGPWGRVAVEGPFGLCGLPPENLAFEANNGGSVNLGDGAAFAGDVMTVALWFRSAGSEGGDRIFTNNRPDRSDHFQITLGAAASLVIGIDPNSETIADSLQVPESAARVKDGQWHHIVASRNGPTMAGVLVVIDGVDQTGALVDSTTGWGRTGVNAHLASRPGGDGGPNRQTLNGAVDEAAIWLGRQLTVQEAQDLYYAAATCIPPARVSRTFTPAQFGGGEPVDVTLEVVADAPGTDLFIEEALPALAVPSDISDGGLTGGAGLQWTLAGIERTTLTYRITAPACSGDLVFGQSYFEVGASRGRVTGELVVGRKPGDAELGAWESGDMGPAGGFVDALEDHRILIQGAGAGVRLSSDEGHLVSIPASGPFELTAAVECVDDVNFVGQAGLMARDDRQQNSTMVFFYYQNNSPGAASLGTLRAIFRPSVGRPTSTVVLSERDVVALPIHLRVRREVDSGVDPEVTKVVFLRSEDGTAFRPVGERVIGTGNGQVNLKPDVLTGLVVSGGFAGTARAVFGSVSGPSFREAPGPTFRRGDSDSSGTLDLSDAVKLLGFLFLGQDRPECLDAADFDDSGEADISDAVANLSYQFLGAAPPPAPGAVDCGKDPAAETPDLGCEKGCP